MSIASSSVSFDCQRIYHVDMDDMAGGAANGGTLDTGGWDALCANAKSLGFDSVLAAPIGPGRNGAWPASADMDNAIMAWDGSSLMTDVLTGLSSVCAKHGLGLMIDLVVDAVADPREGIVVEAGRRRLAAWAQAGVAGFRCRMPSALAKEDWRLLIDHVRSSRPRCHFMAWTPGLSSQRVGLLKGAGFDATFSSLPWWDCRATWLIDEHARLRAVAPVFSPIADFDTVVNGTDPHWAQAGNDARRKIWTAAIAGCGILVAAKWEKVVGSRTLVQVNKWLESRSAATGRLRILSGALSPATVLFRSGAGLLINPDAQGGATQKWADVRARLPHDYALIRIVPDPDEPPAPPTSDTIVLEPGGFLLFLTSSDQAVTATSTTAEGRRKAVVAALRSPRIAIENVRPVVDNGRFPVKTQIGEVVLVQADIFMDGHDRILASLLWRTADETSWRETPMILRENDRWEAGFTPERIGKYCFMIRAWQDQWGSYREHLEKKLAAGQDVALDVEEGRILLSNAIPSDTPPDDAAESASESAQVLMRILGDVGAPRQASRPNPKRAAAPRRASGFAAAQTMASAQPEHIQLLLSDAVATAMRKTSPRRFETCSEKTYELNVERREASFASWYELFPRSCGPATGVHGTFKDVIRRLPAIRDMGFDVLYFPPIHPIGLSHRKGKNNALQSSPHDPGSPYAIGSALGGHTATHPQLGSLQDFLELVACARRHDLEIALDFAIQCSPDHPWLTQHPEWFPRRADGSLRYAENPPKKYEDIVTPDFYSTHASASKQMALWRELRDVVLFWVEQGIRTFRVDNPHTKPLPFWQWLISDIQGGYPDVLFLSEAFTRPKMMYRLAKIGFSQSYTYFTWRNGKGELTDYLTELSRPPIADFFRPNFFVNTPDINPYFLQTSGRAGFLIRAALATTTSGLWGMYSGFELCEARALPGREEYQNSEKYELRTWDWDRPGNIIPEITKLNLIRRANPALQSHLGIRFHYVDDEQILFFSKSTPQRDSIVLAAISLNPHETRRGTLELPLWQWGLPDDGVAHLEDLFNDRRFTLSGKYHLVELTPERPFLLWKLLPAT